MSLLDPLFRWDALEELFTDRARVQRMLDFEAALARTESRLRVIPKSAAAPIASKCRAGLFDMPSLASAAARAGNLAIPLVKQLTELVAMDDADAARYVHWGSTSQDAIDTGFVMQLRPALEKIEAELDRLVDSVARLAKKHRATPVAARTWMQQALPTTFVSLRRAGLTRCCGLRSACTWLVDAQSFCNSAERPARSRRSTDAALKWRVRSARN